MMINSGVAFYSRVACPVRNDLVLNFRYKMQGHTELENC